MDQLGFGTVLGIDDLFQNAPCGYVILDADGLIVRANLVIQGWTGLSSVDLIGKRLPDLLRVAGRIFYETHVAPLLKIQGSLSEIALALKVSDGSTVQVLVNAVERKDADGKLVGTYVVMFAASERRRYERALVTAQESAESARKEVETLNVSLSGRTEEAIAQRLVAETGLLVEKETAVLREQFIAVLGHDLRNPLAAMSSAARILSKEALSDRGRNVIDLMQGSIKRMAGLIDNVLDFARGSLGGGIGIKVEAEGELSHILSHVVDELRAGHPHQVIDTVIDVPVAIECDGGRIGQLLSNLLGNAITHGNMHVPIRVTACVVSDNLEICVINGGRPIPPAALERLFQPFFRANGGEPTQGLGLGLHIASEIAKAHSGSITVSSNGIETKFTFMMPVIRPSSD